jgi:hypothetical protein
VWNWRAEEDIPISETSPRWRGTNDPVDQTMDPYHFNAIEWTGDGFLISFRHLDAVYKVDYATRDILWKLGGSPRPESLRVVGDPVFAAGGSFSGQHDARSAGGLLTVFDNGTDVGRAPRSVTYRVDQAARTATMVDQMTDAIAPSSRCCGSTRVLPGGNRVTGWGGGRWITENRPDGTQVFRLDATIVYRGTPILDGQFTRDGLRAGMDAQFQGGGPVLRSEPAVEVPPAADPAGDLAFRLGQPRPAR